MSRVRNLKVRKPLIVGAMLSALFSIVSYGALTRDTTFDLRSAAAENTVRIFPESVEGRVEVELITLRTVGFEPSEIIRPKGPFVLLIDDRSGKDVSSLRLQKIQGESLRDVNTNRSKSEWHDLIDLPPGDYVLTDRTNPEKRCQITIQP